MAASIYGVDLTQNIDPATPDYGRLAKAELISGQATAELIKDVGGMAVSAYYGSKEAEAQTKLKAEQQSYMGDYKAIQDADTANKAAFEQRMGMLSRERTDAYNQSIFSGAGEAASVEAAGATKQGAELPIIQEYRDKQKKIVAARDEMPQRYQEFMTRSETILKDYISKYPGLANNFRAIAQETTGQQRLDLYSVHKLYQDVQLIEKQKTAAAEAQAKAVEKQRESYVADREKGGVSKTRAAAEFESFDSKTRLDMADLAVAEGNAKANAEAALKLGGEGIRNYVTSSINLVDIGLVKAQGAFLAQLEQLGVSRTQFATNQIPEDIRNKPEFKKIIDEAGSVLLNTIESSYQTMLTDLDKQRQNKTVSADAFSQASKDINDWHTAKVKALTENKTSALLALSGSSDLVKTANERFTLINKYVQMFQLPPDVVSALYIADPKSYNATAARYPEMKFVMDKLRDAARKSLTNISDTEFLGILREVDTYDKNGGVTSIPKDTTQQSAALVDVQKQDGVVRNKIQNNEPIVADDLFKLITSGMATPANTSYYTGSSRQIVDMALQKMSPEERAALNTRVATQADSFVYGFNNFGDATKQLYDQSIGVNKLPFIISDLASSYTFEFTDAMGNTQLKVAPSVVPKNGLTPQQQATFKQNADARLENPELNKRLVHIDNILRTQSQITGTPIQELRRKFMDTFRKEGSVSTAYTSSLVTSQTFPIAQQGEATIGSMIGETYASLKRSFNSFLDEQQQRGTIAIKTRPEDKDFESWFKRLTGKEELVQQPDGSYRSMPIGSKPPASTQATDATSSVKTQELEDEALVRKAQETMKASDPSWNVQYGVDAYKRATPKEKKRIVDEIKKSNLFNTDTTTKRNWWKD